MLGCTIWFNDYDFVWQIRL